MHFSAGGFFVCSCVSFKDSAGMSVQINGKLGTKERKVRRAKEDPPPDHRQIVNKRHRPLTTCTLLRNVRWINR